MEFAKKALLVFVSGLGALLLTEILLQTYVTHVARQGKLFQTAVDTGWATIPNYHLVRRNAAGLNWTIDTDAGGLRNLPAKGHPSHTLLILGDSFAFGEGVNIEDRFDRHLGDALPAFRFINTGTMGFGTDQEYVIGRRYFGSLGEGDAVLLLFYINDFFDVLRRRFALRSKPYFERRGGELVLRAPELGFREWLRDRSYLAALLGRAVEPRQNDHWDFAESANIVREVMGRMRREIGAGVRLVLAYHGSTPEFDMPKSFTGAMFCGLADVCIDLNSALTPGRAHFLPDGHWTAEGHARVGSLLAAELGDARNSAAQ